MAGRNTRKPTPFEQESIEVAKTILDYKLSAEANTVAILYKEPENLYNVNLTLESFSNNVWKVFFVILHDLIMVEGKSAVDEIIVGAYLEKHPKLRSKYEEYGGWATIDAAMSYVQTQNLESNISEMKKWSTVLQLVKKGFPVKDRLSDYVDMSEQEIYEEFEVYLNHIFISADSDVKSYNVFEDIFELIDEMNHGSEVGMPFYNAPLLTAETGGFNLNGHIYGLGASSGIGKSTMAFNYIIPSAIQYHQRAVFIVNEEDERAAKKNLIVWVANNIFKEEIQKRTLRDGNFNEKTLEILKKSAEWIEEKREQRIFTIIPLERYSANIAIKIIKKYAKAYSVRIFCIDTLKESYDAKSDEIFKTMMRDMVELYNVVKPSALNVGLFVTYQLGKGSLKLRYLSNAEIGQSRSIVDVFSCNLMMRRPYEDEYDGGKNEIYCYRLDGANGKTKIPFKLKKEDHPMITFITKSRFGVSGGAQIVSSCNLSTNVCRDLGFCNIVQDF